MKLECCGFESDLSYWPLIYPLTGHSFVTNIPSKMGVRPKTAGDILKKICYPKKIGGTVLKKKL